MSRSSWTERARDDLARIDDHHRGIDEAVAVRFGQAALAAARFLADNPGAGPHVELDLRKWRVRGTPYLLFYRRSGDAIEVVRVRHAQEDRRRA